MLYIRVSGPFQKHLNIRRIHYLKSHYLVPRQETKNWVDCFSKKAEKEWFFCHREKEGAGSFWCLGFNTHASALSPWSLVKPGMNSVQLLREIYLPSILSYSHPCCLNSLQSHTAQFLLPASPHQNIPTICEIATTEFVKHSHGLSRFWCLRKMSLTEDKKMSLT